MLGFLVNHSTTNILNYLRFGLDIMKIITNPKYKVGGHYSQGRIVGNLLYTCGHVAYNTETGLLVNNDIKQETLTVLQNLNALANIAGTDLQKSVKITSYLTDMKLFKGYDDAFQEFFPKNPPPRTTVQVGPLIRDVHVEIEAIISIDS